MTRINSHSAVSVNSPVFSFPGMMGHVWSRTRLIREFLDIMQSVEAWRGARITETSSGFTFTVNGVTLGHLNWGGQLALACGPEARTAIEVEQMGFDERDQCGEDVIVFNIRSAADVDRALCLLRFSYLISDLDRNECRPSREVDIKAAPMPSCA